MNEGFAGILWSSHQANQMASPSWLKCASRHGEKRNPAVSALGEAVVLLRLDAAQRPTERGIERKLDRLAERHMNDTSRRPPLPALRRTWRGTLRSHRAGAWPLGQEQSAMRLHA